MHLQFASQRCFNLSMEIYFLAKTMIVDYSNLLLSFYPALTNINLLPRDFIYFDDLIKYCFYWI